MKKYEYKLVDFVPNLHITKETEKLDKIGEDGWKLMFIHDSKYYFRKVKKNKFGK